MFFYVFASVNFCRMCYVFSSARDFMCLPFTEQNIYKNACTTLIGLLLYAQKRGNVIGTNIYRTDGARPAVQHRGMPLNCNMGYCCFCLSFLNPLINECRNVLLVYTKWKPISSPQIRVHTCKQQAHIACRLQYTSSVWKKKKFALNYMYVTDCIFFPDQSKYKQVSI